MENILRSWFFRNWYWFISKKDKQAEVLFMNFGYHNEEISVTLLPEDEKNRYSIQLYQQLATRADLAEKDICEIGSGRGGGLAWIHKTCKPRSAVGVDLNRRAADFCNRHNPMPGLRFMQGNAQALPFADEVFDIVLNVESSHRYPSFPAFLAEVYRTLRSGGQLLFTDFRWDHEMDELKDDIRKSGFQITDQEIITPYILKALEYDDARRRDLVRRLIPVFLQKLALNFAGAKDSKTYKNFEENKFIYFVYVLKK